MSNTSSSTTFAVSSVVAFLVALARGFVNLLQVSKTKVASMFGQIIRKFGARNDIVLAPLQERGRRGDFACDVFDVRTIDTEARHEFEVMMKKYFKEHRLPVQRPTRKTDKPKCARQLF